MNTTWSSVVQWFRPSVIFALLFGAQFTTLVLISPRFFWTDDALTQYSGVWWWLGENQEGLLPPLMNPELGGQNSFVADMQYGVFSPLHWVIQGTAGAFDSPLAFSQLFGALCLFVLGFGALVQLLLRNVNWVLAVSAALGVSFSGYVIWQGSTWWPLMLSLGWLLWIWNGLTIKRAWGAIVVGVSAALLFASGYPYFLPWAAVLVVLHLTEIAWRARSLRALIQPRQVGNYVALLAALIWSAPTLLSMIQASSYTYRGGPYHITGNSGLGVPNLIDVVLGGPTLLAALNNFWGVPMLPAATTWIAAIPLLAMIDWRRAFFLRGVPTGVGLVVLALVSTQLPAVLFGFRNPMNSVAVAQIILPIIVVIGLTYTRKVTQSRLAVVGLLVLSQIALALFRAPVFWKWHLLGGLITIAVVVAVIYLTAETKSAFRWHRAVAISVALAASASLFLSVGMMRGVSVRWAEQMGVELPAGAVDQPWRISAGYGVTATTVEEFREVSLKPDGEATYYPFLAYNLWGNAVDDTFNTRALPGTQNLFANTSGGYGYNAAVMQKYLAAHSCREQWGAVCDPDALLQKSGIGGTRWIDLVSQREILVEQSAPYALKKYLQQSDDWDRVPSPDKEWIAFEKTDSLPGRVVFASAGVKFDDDWETSLARVGQDMERYVVSTKGQGGIVVFYTTYWPGLEARVNGEPIKVSSLDNSILVVELPAGLDSATLTIRYNPIGAVILWPSLVLATLLVLVSPFVTVVLRRIQRGGRRSTISSDG